MKPTQLEKQRDPVLTASGAGEHSVPEVSVRHLTEQSEVVQGGRDPSDHLSDEEFVGLVLEDLAPHVEVAVSLHVDQCEACAHALVEYYSACDDYDRLSAVAKPSR